MELPNDVDSVIGKYCIVRTYSAGVFAGVVQFLNRSECRVTDARRLWYWKGAATLSELSQRGVKYPNECKFPCVVPMVCLTNVIEIIPCTLDAKTSIEEVPEWRAT